MSNTLLNEKELQEAIHYEIISPSFAERVHELIKAYEKVASQQSVQSDGATVCTCGEPATINNAWCETCFPDTGRH